jgi:hypothetical protein
MPRFILLSLASLFVLPAAAPQTAATPVASSAPTVVPSLVAYSGETKALAGEAAITFLIYKDDTGGEPLWVETQTVAIDPTGHYKVQLGAANPNGLPADLFSTGEARWLDVQIAGQPSQPRILLASVPYALKAADATTLGGLPASAFALAGTRIETSAAFRSDANAPTTDVTTTGGLSGYLPEFSGSATIVDSPVFVSGADIGIGTATPIAMLDVNGTAVISGLLTANSGETVAGSLEMAPTATATASTPYNSQVLKLYSSAYNSSTKEVVNPRFGWQARATGNDTAAPSATLDLLSSTTGAAPSPTGFSFNADGTINFASAQTFPAATFTGTISASSAAANGFGVEATTSGGQAVSIYGNATGPGGYGLEGIADGGLAGGVFPPVGVYGESSGGTGVVAASTTGTAVSAYTTGALTTSVLSYTSGAGGIAMRGVSTGANDSLQDSVGVYGESTNGGYGVEGISSTGNGIEGVSTTGAAAYFTSAPPESPSVSIYNTAGNDQSGIPPKGLYIDVSGEHGIGIEAYSNQGEAIYGNLNYVSTESELEHPNSGGGAVHGDSGNNEAGTASGAGVLGTADDTYAGYFANNSTSRPTLYAFNRGTGTSGNLFKTFQASTADGTCGFGDKGNLTCTGQVKTLAATSKSRMVESYAMQSPENWMEDFGSGTLTHGLATVAIDPAFAETANTSADYHVFLTPKGDSKGLYVANETAGGFEVRESGGGTSSVAFDYRIVAKRLGHETERLVDVTDRFHAETAETSRQLQAAASAHREGPRIGQTIPGRPARIAPHRLQPPPPPRLASLR